MISRSLSPEFSPFTVGEDLTPLPDYKAPSTTSIDFSNLLSPPLLLREDLKSGCGGQLWPAGMVLAQQMLRYHRESLKNARMFVLAHNISTLLTNIYRLELGAGGGLVGLGVAMGCIIDHPIYITDQENMLELMAKNIELNGLESRAVPLVLNWSVASPLSKDIGLI
jgi:hypothetical protein